MGFNLQATLGLDGAAFFQTLNKANTAARGFGKSFGAAVGSAASMLKANFATAFGVGAVAGVTAAAKTVSDYASKVDDLSERLGVSRTALQEWDYALKINGSNIETGARFLEALNISRKRALQGNEEAIESFRELGISLEDLQRMNTSDIGRKIGDAVKIGDPQKLIGALREVGGRAAGEVIPAMKSGLREAADEANRFGAIINDGLVRELAKLNDEIDKVKSKLQGLFANKFLGGLVNWTGKGLEKLSIWGQMGKAYVETKGRTGSVSEAMAAAKAARLKAEEEISVQKQVDEARRQRRQEGRLAAGTNEFEFDRRESKQSKVRSLQEKLMGLIEENDQARLTAEQKILELTEKRAKILEVIKTRGSQMSPEGQLQAAIDVETLTKEIAALKGVGNQSTGDRAMDSLAKIGGFSQGANSRLVTLQERTARATEETARNTGRQLVGDGLN